jgi:N-acetylglucosamine malate deacetylase 2
MSGKAMARGSGKARIPPGWTSVLVVIAHPDDESFGLGAVLDAFITAGVRVEVLCLTHGQVWTLDEAPGDLAALRGAGLASAADVLGPDSISMQGHPEGALGDLCQSRLAIEVVAAADSCHPDGLLAFDASAVTGSPEHRAATSAGLLAAETLGLPVLGWTLSAAAAAQLSRELDACITGQQDEQVDLRVTFERARQRLASHENARQSLPGSAQWRRLEVLAATSSLRWLRPPGGVAGQPKAPAHRAANV